MGKLIYQPKGKAREYAPWACNLFNGCSNRCEYCYNRHSVGAKVLGKDESTLKVGATLEQFRKELERYKERILADKKGLFFSFVSDPFLEETWSFNFKCAITAAIFGVPVVFLSKKVPPGEMKGLALVYNPLVKIGFTLTGCDELEPDASTNAERIECIKELTSMGVKTWASIEPVIDLKKSDEMIHDAYLVGCREFKIGLLSGKKKYTPQQVMDFYQHINYIYGPLCDIYWKESVMDYISKIK